MKRFLIKTLILLVLATAIFGSAAFFGYMMFVMPKEELRDDQAAGMTASPPPDTTIPEFEKCMALVNQHKVIESRAALENFIANYPASTRLEAAKDALGRVNVDIFLSAIAAPEKEAYTIQKGDALAKIEKKLKVSGGMIMRSNNIDNPRMLRVGDVLYVSHPQFSLVVSRKEHEVTLYNHAKFFKQYRATTWNVPPSKTNAPITAKVTDVAAFVNSQRVAPGTREFVEAPVHWIQFSASSYTLYTDPHENGTAEVPAAGIALNGSEMDELSALLTRGVPVTIE